MKPPNEKLGLHLHKHICEKKKPAKIISLVREPIGRNISAYFQNLDAFKRIENAHTRFDIDELINDFLKNYHHRVPLEWFDKEMKPAIGIDAFSHEFPKDIGYKIIHEQPYDVLIMRHDIEDKRKAEIISDFLHLTNFSIQKKNISSQKKYAGAYYQFLNKVKLPPEYVDELLNSKYTRHFYSTEMIKAFKEKWTV